MKEKLKLNVATSLMLQIITIICGFILPRLILNAFGSVYNGIINSVNQFLSCVTLLRAGIGGVTRAALYKPLADNDNYKISSIINATERFMRKIAFIFGISLVIFAAIYPIFVKENFNFFFTFSLVIILGISTIAQYYFGITYQFLLQADQKLYVYNFIQIIATILNTILSVILILLKFDIRIVKLASAISFGIVPIMLFFYVKRNYNINKNIEANNSTIEQRWDAFAHQIASFVHTNTDIMVLTIFSDLYNVSIYSIYNMIIYGVKQLICICSNSLESFFGSILAKDMNNNELNEKLGLYEWLINAVSIVLLGCTTILVVPFVMIYTKGVIDTNYNQPIFAYLLCLATFLSCIRLPYQNIVEAAGHFKQTRNGAIIEALINVIISIIFVTKYGCIGVTIGTICAMSYRTIQYAVYASKEILKRDVRIFFKNFSINLITFILIIGVCIFGKIDSFLIIKINNYFLWCIYGILTFVLVFTFVFVINVIFYPKEIYMIKKRLKR